MTRRRFYAPSSAFAPDDHTVTLSAEETRHLRSVLRLQRGDEVYAFDGEGREYRCLISEIGRSSAKLDLIEQVEPASPESSLDLALAIALLKGEKFDLVVQKATELGVTRVVPIVTARADVRIRNAEEAKRKTERWQRIALESAKQCGRARLIRIDAPVTFESLISRPERNDELRLMFVEREEASLTGLAASLRSRPAQVIALVGSEGGWTDDEIARARAQHWQILTLGGRTLRAETAAIAVATLLQHAFGDLV
jgi:16S rRNA (uracil1498-N3)-methyltransferase